MGEWEIQQYFPVLLDILVRGLAQSYTLEQILQRFTAGLFCEQEVWLLGANTGLCPPLLSFIQIPALESPCVATSGLSFKITVESSLVTVSWGSACSDYPCNPCNVRLASRP